jgi:hypothetical protein
VVIIIPLYDDDDDIVVTGPVKEPEVKELPPNPRTIPYVLPQLIEIEFD